MTPQTIRNIAGVTGYVALVAGLAVIDWPSAVAVGGGLLLAGAIYGTAKDRAND